MGRIALFVAVVAGLVWLAIGPLASAAGLSPDPMVRASVAVIAAVIVWTALVWRFADRQAARKPPGEGALGGGTAPEGAASAAREPKRGRATYEEEGSGRGGDEDGTRDEKGGEDVVR